MENPLLQLIFDIISMIILGMIYNQTIEKKKYTVLFTLDSVIIFKLSLALINSLDLGF